MANLEELAGLPGGQHHAPRALERVRHLLLAVHVLAGLEAIDRVLRVPEVGRGDDHRVELLLLVEHLAVVLVAVHLVLELPHRVDSALLVVFLPDVAHRPEPQTGNAEHRFGQHLALGACADEGDVDLLQAGGGGRRLRGLLQLRLLIAPLLLPRVAEETERGDGRQPLQHVAPIQLSWTLDSGLRLVFTLLVVDSHRRLLLSATGLLARRVRYARRPILPSKESLVPGTAEVKQPTLLLGTCRCREDPCLEAGASRAQLLNLGRAEEHEGGRQGVCHRCGRQPWGLLRCAFIAGRAPAVAPKPTRRAARASARRCAGR